MSKDKKLSISVIFFIILLIGFLIIKIAYPIKIENENIAYYYDGLPLVLSFIVSILSLFVYITLNNDAEQYSLKDEIFMAFWSLYPLIGAFYTGLEYFTIPFLVITIIYLLLMIYKLVGKERKPINNSFKIRQVAKISIITNAVIYGPINFLLYKIGGILLITEYIYYLFLIIIPALSFIIILSLLLSDKLFKIISTNSVKLNVAKLFMFLSFIIQIVVVMLYLLLIIDFYLFNKANYSNYSNGLYIFNNFTMISSLVTFIIYLKTNQYDYKKDEIFLLYWSFYPLAIYFISNFIIILLLSIIYLGLLIYNLFFKSKQYEVFYADMKKAGIRIAVTNGVIMAIQIDVILLLNIFEVKENVIWKIFQYVPIPVFIIFLIIHIILIRNYKLASKYEKKIDY